MLRKVSQKTGHGYRQSVDVDGTNSELNNRSDRVGDFHIVKENLRASTGKENRPGSVFSMQFPNSMPKAVMIPVKKSAQRTGSTSS